MSDNGPNPYAPRRPSSPPGDAARPVPRGAPSSTPVFEDFPATGPNALATFSQRAWARSADVLLTFTVAFVVFLFVYAVLAEGTVGPDGQTTAETERIATEVWSWMAAGWIIIAAVYETVAVAGLGRTVGKWALGLRVARFTDGTRPAWAQAALRGLLPATAGMVAWYVAQLPALGVLVVLASSYLNPLRRGWHDAAGGTVVVRTR